MADKWAVLDLLLVGAPILAIALATLPLLRMERAAPQGEPAAIIAVRVRRLNMAVIGAALVIGLVLAWYFAGEVLLATGA